MKKFTLFRIILFGIAVIILIIAIVLNLFNRSGNTQSIIELPVTGSSINEVKKPTLDNDISIPSPIQVSNTSPEKSISAAANKFLNAYYNLDTNGEQDKYITCLDGTLTQNGLNNIKKSLQRPGGKDPQLRIERSMYTSKVFISTKGEKDASALCAVSIRQVLTVLENEPVETYDPILIRLELKQEADGVWRVNNISLERSLSTLTMDYSALY